MSVGFYRRTGKFSYLAKEETTGPWSLDAQHGGPPCALLASVIDQCSFSVGTQIAKISVEFLRPVPLGELWVDVTLVRQGHKISLWDAILSNEAGPLMLARAWRLKRDVGRVPAVSMRERSAVNLETIALSQLDYFPYIANIDWKFEVGDFDVLGPAVVHGRAKIPLVEDEETSGLAQLLLLADSANGISKELTFEKFLFVPVDLMCSLVELPDPGEFITFDAMSRISESGSGISEATISQHGRYLGSSLHTLYVEPRREI